MTKILWADDEIDLLKPHIMFLEQKGYTVTAVTSGDEAIEEAEKDYFDIVFLDENMPGLTGLETLSRIKDIRPSVPCVMITKSEEESLMEDAIGGKIADYLIKPVNPNQILLSIKKNIDNTRLVSEKTNLNYQQEFRQIGMRLGDRLDFDEWKEMYDKLTYWELELDEANSDMRQILEMQKKEANNQFSKFIEDNYEDWIESNEGPLLSHNVIKEKVFPELEKPFMLFVVDNLRYDQWKIIRKTLSQTARVVNEEIFYSILPTATQYARNALFAGMMPGDIANKFPQFWRSEDDEGSKNMFEKELLQENMKKNRVDKKMGYNKITNLNAGKKLVDQFSNLKNNDFNVVVYNFVDMLSHAKTDMAVIKELADNDEAYRSLTLSWFEHSPLLELMQKAIDSGIRIGITTDHGTIKCTNPIKVIGERNTNTNLRYKTGRNLNYSEKEVYAVHYPENIKLPKGQLSAHYIFAKNSDYFVYPNNYNQFVHMYRDTFQHGGISMEEVLVPFAIMEPK
jgi:CheY-like chemotaxis protein